MNSLNREVYLDSVVEQAPRLLGLMDRGVDSKTYGCFDRYYWHYKIIDFPCARYQEAVLTIALLYKYGPYPYKNNSNILRWINAGLNFWCAIQRRNGSFDEWYPRENSFVASAFSAYAVSETLLELGEDLIKDHKKLVLHLERVGEWLLKKDDLRVSNQTSGAIAALYNIFILTNNPKYKIAAERKAGLMKEAQNEEGWFYEYGGADIGYLSLTIDYLVKYYHKSGSELSFSMISKSIDFISEFIYPGFTFGGSYGSRNTEYLIPSGFEIMAAQSPKAANCAMNIRKATAEQSAISLYSFDDRYLCYIGYNWLQAYIYATNIQYPAQVIDRHIVYPHAGIYIMRKKDLFFVANFKKGGAFNLFLAPDKKIFDGGVIVEDQRGRQFYSGYLGCPDIHKKQEGEFTIRGSFKIVRQIKPTTLKFLLLRIFQILLGRYEKVGIFLKQRLRDKLITEAPSANLTFTRTIKFKEDGVNIIERINLGDIPVKKIILGAKDSFIFVPSSRYFHDAELGNIPLSMMANEISHYRKGNDFIFERCFKKSAKEISG